LKLIARLGRIVIEKIVVSGHPEPNNVMEDYIMEFKNVAKILLALLLVSLSPAIAETASGPATANASGTASPAVALNDAAGFPLQLKGTEVLIDTDAKREDLESRLTKLLGEPTQMEEKTRLQYDFQIDLETAPITLVFDWDTQGKLAEIILDGESPVTLDLKAWLEKNVGNGKADKNDEEVIKSMVWEARGWQFTHRAGGENEDTVYSFNIVPLKSN